MTPEEKININHLSASPTSIIAVLKERIKIFNTFWDSRFEDIKRDTWIKTTYRDFSAGLIVALTAIPMAMGFSMAMGLRPEQGIIAGALACIVGRTFGGSKYQVYGPTAAFIPVISSLVRNYGEASGGTLANAHGFLVLVSIIAGIILMGMGLFGLGKYAKLVPNSIVVGFTAGIAVAIAASNLESVLGISDFSELLDEDADIQAGLESIISSLCHNLGKINGWAITLGLLTFALTKILLRISIFIPAPAIAIGLCTWLAGTVLSNKGLILVRDLYGTIPTNFFVFTPPILPVLNTNVLFDIFYYVSAIVFVSGVESLLCSSMADRLADNRGTPFNPNKEFWGQGLVQIITPLVNGFPCTGALARTATSIKAGAVTPLAGYFKGALKLLLAYLIADYLEMIPMACIGGILLWVASNMIKWSEIREVLNHNKFHAILMAYTAIMVPATDFLTGVLTALILYFGTRGFFDKSRTITQEVTIDDHSNLSETIRITPGKFKHALIAISSDLQEKSLINYTKYLMDIGVIDKVSFFYVTMDTSSNIDYKHFSRDLIAKELYEIIETDYPNSIIDISFHKTENNRNSLVSYIQAHKIDVVLLSYHHTSADQRSLAQQLAMVSSASVWMIPAGFNPKITAILSPIDFSPASADSLRQAIGIAKKAHLSEVSTLHVYFDPSVLRYEEHDAIIKNEENTRFNQFMESIDTLNISINKNFEERSSVAHAILSLADKKNTDLIVINTRGRSRAAMTVLGSVTADLMAEAHIPVLVIKHFGDRASIINLILSGKILDEPDLTKVG